MSPKGSSCHCSLFNSAPSPEGDENAPYSVAGAATAPSGM
jgi:hypothetical protein